MPRQARQASGTGIYHVMMRGINHQNILDRSLTRMKENRQDKYPAFYRQTFTFKK